MHLIAAILALFRKPIAIVEDEAPVPVAPEWRDRWCDPYAIVIRRLAFKKSNGPLMGADFAQLRGHHGDWMTLLAKPALIKLVGATDDALYGHLTGKRVIRGVFSADRETVLAEKARRKKASFARIVTDDGRRSGGGPLRTAAVEVEAEFQQLFEQIMSPSPGGPRR